MRSSARSPANLLLTLLLFSLALLRLASADPQTQNAVLVPTDLRCESLENPLGIDSLHPRLSWKLRPSNPALRGLRQSGYRIVVASSAEILAQDKGDLWDTGKIASAQTGQIEYIGKPLAANERYFWKVQVWEPGGSVSSWSDTDSWTMGLLRPDDWKAKWIAAGQEPSSETSSKGSVERPLPIFRRSFRLTKPIVRAVAYASGLGQFELRINGAKISDDVMTPGWTAYRKTVFYNSYDVTSVLKTGENAAGVLVGNGMYNVPDTEGRYTKFTGSFGQPKAIVQIEIRYADGTKEVVASDSSWKQSPGPITFSSTYGGEDYDARQEQPGWDAPGFADENWRPAVEVSGPGGVLASQKNFPIRVMKIFKPVKQTTPAPGVLVYDLGQNFAGWPQITVSGSAGQTLKLIPGELLDETGRVTQRSSGGPMYFSYTVRGSGNETWHPRFTYYGFRYVQVEGAKSGEAPADRPVIKSLEGQFTYSSAPVVGIFSTSNRLFDQIHELIDAAIRSNMQSVMTDCPHREKLGWLEETHLLGPSLMYNFDLSRLYAKIADDMRDSQLADGLVPDIAPEYVVFEKGFRDSPEWGSAAVLDPWLAYQFYGDREIVSQHYETMRRYVDYLSSRAENHIVGYGLGDWYDIGPGEPGESKLTSRGVTATAIYYLDLQVLQKAGKLLGKSDDSQKYAALAAEVRKSFNSKLFDPETNQYDTGSQTANAMPLAVGLVEESRRGAVLESLIQDIRKHGNHVTAGDVGFHFVVQGLTEGGRSDVLYDMLSRTDSPSYGYQLSRGATTLTEAWDTDPHSSQNHFMLGHAEEWFYRGLAGINFDLSQPPDSRIEIKPAPVGDVASAQADYESVVGSIHSAWTRKDGKLTLDVTIPPNMTATIYVPAKDGEKVLESGDRLNQAKGVKLLRTTANALVCHVSSGQYRFEVKK